MQIHHGWFSPAETARVAMQIQQTSLRGDFPVSHLVLFLFFGVGDGNCTGIAASLPLLKFGQCWEICLLNHCSTVYRLNKEHVPPQIVQIVWTFDVLLSLRIHQTYYQSSQWWIPCPGWNDYWKLLTKPTAGLFSNELQLFLHLSISLFLVCVFFSSSFFWYVGDMFWYVTDSFPPSGNCRFYLFNWPGPVRSHEV